MPVAADETSVISSNAPLCMDASLLFTLLELIALEKLVARRHGPRTAFAAVSSCERV